LSLPPNLDATRPKITFPPASPPNKNLQTVKSTIFPPKSKIGGRPSLFSRSRRQGQRAPPPSRPRPAPSRRPTPRAAAHAVRPSYRESATARAQAAAAASRRHRTEHGGRDSQTKARRPEAPLLLVPALAAAAGRRDSPAPGCGSRLLASSVGRDARARGQRPQGGAARPLRVGRRSRPQALHGEPKGLASG